jgi:hypothetical protein
MLPFLLLLYPEGLLLPTSFVWTVWAAILFSLVLCFGSTGFAAILAAARFAEQYLARRAAGRE